MYFFSFLLHFLYFKLLLKRILSSVTEVYLILVRMFLLLAKFKAEFCPIIKLLLKRNVSCIYFVCVFIHVCGYSRKILNNILKVRAELKRFKTLLNRKAYPEKFTTEMNLKRDFKWKILCRTIVND